MSAKKEPEGIKIVAQNRRALRDFSVLETLEAGLELQGAEVKSIRDGAVNLKDGYARIDNGQVFLLNVRISPYPQAGRDAPDPERKRRLLLHKREINRLYGQTQERGFTLIPLKVYFNKGKAKLALAVARGKKFEDRRETIKEREAQREMARAVRRDHVGAKRFRR